MDRRRFLLLVPPALLAACGGGASKQLTTNGAQPRAAQPAVFVERITRTPTPSPTPPPQICLVTRTKGVPATYVPRDLVPLPPELSFGTVQLRQPAAEAFLRLMDAAFAAGQRLVAVSGYRSYQEQQIVLEREIKNFGEAQARRQVAEPGHSEHQLGLAVDVTAQREPELDQRFGDEPEGRWLAQHCARFGYVLSYPAGKEAITGYIYEPWHIRYVGVPLAQQVVASGLTLTEYLPLHRMEGCPEP